MYIYILGEDKPESCIFSHDFIKETPVVVLYINLSTYIRLRNYHKISKLLSKVSVLYR